MARVFPEAVEPDRDAGILMVYDGFRQLAVIAPWAIDLSGFRDRRQPNGLALPLL
jgi:hypothetical protein